MVPNTYDRDINKAEYLIFVFTKEQIGLYFEMLTCKNSIVKLVDLCLFEIGYLIN